MSRMQRAWERMQKKMASAMNTPSGWSFKTTNNAQMKNFFFVLGSAAITLMATSCSKSNSSTDETTGNWVSRSTFAGAVRTFSTTFSTTNGSTTNMYVVTGLNTSATSGAGGNDTVLNQTWQCMPNTNGDVTWTQVNSYIPIPASTGADPSRQRYRAVAFGLGNYGYVGLGQDRNGIYYKDFYRYDVAANTWSPGGNWNSFPGAARAGAVAFVIGDHAYVGTGKDGFSTYQDCWSYSASEGWKQQPNPPGNSKTDAVAFVINNKGYIVTGSDFSGTVLDDFVSFDPANPDPNKKWTLLSPISNRSQDSFDDDYSDIVRRQSVAFVINNKAYISTGVGGTGGLSVKTWMFNPAESSGSSIGGLWHRRSDYETNLGKQNKRGAIAFSLNGLGYIGLGDTGSDSSPTQSFVSFNPDQSLDTND